MEKKPTRNHRISWLVLLALGSIAVNPQPATAQKTAQETAPLTITPTQTLSTPITQAAERSGQLNRAKNLARQAAERANGGLNNYRAEASMHGLAAESPFVDNGDGTVTFSFTGSAPGSSIPTVKTIATVNLITGEVLLNYNGSINGR